MAKANEMSSILDRQSEAERKLIEEADAGMEPTVFHELTDCLRALVESQREMRQELNQLAGQVRELIALDNQQMQIAGKILDVLTSRKPS